MNTSELQQFIHVYIVWKLLWSFFRLDEHVNIRYKNEEANKLFRKRTFLLIGLNVGTAAMCFLVGLLEQEPYFMYVRWFLLVPLVVDIWEMSKFVRYIWTTLQIIFMLIIFAFFPKYREPLTVVQIVAMGMVIAQTCIVLWFCALLGRVISQ